ncbi:MAG: PEGA domain-containing protein, partial [Candidatus Eremiobacteraeota bacterium]|nr:PEGA domain-containing protein [Candidatus Eremiobacteraeota bacterium]
MRRPSLPAILFTATLLGGLGALAAAFEPKPQGQTASLDIVSEPAGAEVLLDNKEIGKTPLTRERSSDSHKLTFRLPGYVPAEIVLNEHSERIHQRLSPQPASLRVTGAGQAKLRLGPGVGRTLEGKGPWKLAPGQYELTAVRAKIPARPRRFELKPGQSLEIALDWPALPAVPVPVPRPTQARPPAAPLYTPPQSRPRYHDYQPPRPVYRPPA